MREEKLIAVGLVVIVLMGLLYALSSCGSGSTYYHVPGFDTHKSKTHKPSGGSGFKWGGSTTRKR